MVIWYAISRYIWSIHTYVSTHEVIWVCGGYNGHINVPDCKPYFHVFACFFSSDYAGAIGDVLAQFLGSRGLSWYPQTPPTRPRSPWRYVVVCLLATWEPVFHIGTIHLLGLRVLTRSMESKTWKKFRFPSLRCR